MLPVQQQVSCVSLSYCDNVATDLITLNLVLLTGDAMLFSGDATKCSTSLCQSLETFSGQHTNQMCQVNEFTEGFVNSATGNATVDVCVFSKEYDATLKKLQDLRISYVVFLIVSVLLTGYYLYAL